MKILAISSLLASAVLATALPASAASHKGDHMMAHKMSAKDMKKMESCKAMDHAMAMKDKRCAKLMMQHDAMAPHDAMSHDAMAPEHK